MADFALIDCIGAANIDRKLVPLGTLVAGSSNPARQHEAFGGVARNIAENLARLGTRVALTTAVGGDAMGRDLLAQARSLGIDTRRTLVADGPTGTYTAVLDERGEMVVAMADMALCGQLTPGIVAPRGVPAALRVADLNLPQSTVAALLAAARDGAPLVLVAVSEPKMAHLPQDLHGLRLLVLNRGELRGRTGRDTSTADGLLAACRDVQAQGARDVVVTLGAHGVAHTTPDGIAHLPAPQARVVDVTGAGDAFAAGACWSLLRERDDLGAACRRGLKLAAVTLACAQTVCPSIDAHFFSQDS